MGGRAALRGEDAAHLSGIEGGGVRGREIAGHEDALGRLGPRLVLAEEAPHDSGAHVLQIDGPGAEVGVRERAVARGDLLDGVGPRRGRARAALDRLPGGVEQRRVIQEPRARGEDGGLLGTCALLKRPPAAVEIVADGVASGFEGGALGPGRAGGAAGRLGRRGTREARGTGGDAGRGGQAREHGAGRGRGARRRGGRSRSRRLGRRLRRGSRLGGARRAAGSGGGPGAAAGSGGRAGATVAASPNPPRASSRSASTARSASGPLALRTSSCPRSAPRSASCGGAAGAGRTGPRGGVADLHVGVPLRGRRHEPRQGARVQPMRIEQLDRGLNRPRAPGGLGRRWARPSPASPPRCAALGSRPRRASRPPPRAPARRGRPPRGHGALHERRLAQEHPLRPLGVQQLERRLG